MPRIRSVIEDSTHIYGIASGSGRGGLVVYLVSSHADRVGLANAGDVLTANAIGVIKRDYGNSVSVDFSGSDVDVVPETGISFSFGNSVFLSSLESGRVTNISPSSGVCLKLGSAVKVKPNGKIEINLLISEVIEL